MKVKCQGYEGELIGLNANEELKQYIGEKPIYTIPHYDITMRTDKSGAKITFEKVKPGEFEVLYT